MFRQEKHIFVWTPSRERLVGFFLLLSEIVENASVEENLGFPDLAMAIVFNELQ